LMRFLWVMLCLFPSPCSCRGFKMFPSNRPEGGPLVLTCNWLLCLLIFPPGGPFPIKHCCSPLQYISPKFLFLFSFVPFSAEPLFVSPPPFPILSRRPRGIQVPSCFRLALFIFFSPTIAPLRDPFFPGFSAGF